MSDDERTTDDGVQGEGNPAAARRYNERTKAFIDKGKVERAIEEAAPADQEEARQLRQAEKAGRSRARS